MLLVRPTLKLMPNFCCAIERVGHLSRSFFQKQSFDAVLSVNEIFAIRGMRLASELGYHIPGDVSFIGFTDGILSKYAVPGLSAIAQHGEQMGETAARMLIDKIENEYGRKIDTYKGSVPIDGVEREVNFFRVGRIALMYQTTDSELSGAWDQTAKQFVALDNSEYRNAIQKGLRIARKQASIDVLKVPVMAAEGAN